MTERYIYNNVYKALLIKIKIYHTSVRMSAGIPVDIRILQSNRNNPKSIQEQEQLVALLYIYILVKELDKL